MVSSRKFSVLLLLFCVVLFLNDVSPVSTELNVRHSFREKLRVKRQGCRDGTYEHNGINCCKCAAGQKVVEHCTKTADDRECAFCDDGTYNSEPNSKDSCEICTSCGPENANLEVKERCTAINDTKCTCKEGYYCPTKEGTCKICHPCTRCDSTGIKDACTPTSDAVCNEESSGESPGLTGGANAGIVIAVFFVVAVVVAVVAMFRKKILGFLKKDTPKPSGPVSDPLLPVDMEPHIVDIAEIIGWKDMCQIALSCQMANSIENAKLSHHNDGEMWTLELLRKWMEAKGMPASVELIAILRKMRKNSKADKIKDILYPMDSPTQCSSA
ncbi:tumor necrosis factor receptor superfamily member 22 isoform X1 [Poecilia latipinna]|uniref:tumor necrosis factor receptor superfamily member 22 isoform X1 n=1 Tax=Poecilia latipinna TaxID=48699 RepID=UPI00072E11E2|nr:PREDICTED: tumor necrosis factor receptor superfamily member 22-like isoform X1 [Poecilia latipinna]